MKENTGQLSYKFNLKLVLTAIFVVLGLWFAYHIISIIFLFFLAVVLTLILNAPTMWLVHKKIPRTLAALLIFFAMLIFVGVIGWLVVPKILEQLGILFNNLPQYYENVKTGLSSHLADYPLLQKRVLSGTAFEEGMPSVMKLATNVGQFSFSLISSFFLLIMFFSIVAYMLISPEPLIETYLTFFSEKNRLKAARALSRSSIMMVGWMKSNLIVGAIEGTAIYFFLTYMNLPGVWVWVGLALFAEMIPKLGLYIMMIPPVLIALSISPLTSLWVLLFYLGLTEITGDFVIPKVRASTMDLHPISSLIVMLAMGLAFGLMGALVATPLTAFIKAYYEEFYLVDVFKENLGKEVELILERKV
jgi:predicted PurR-regulated permease PerM